MEYIEACVISLLNLEYPRKEIVFVDDASTDGTRGVLRKFGVKVVEMKAKGGPAKARNAGTLNSEGEVLAFVDGDCIVPPNWLHNITKHYTPSVGAVGGPNYTPRDQVSFGKWVGYLPGIYGSLCEEYLGGDLVHIRGCNSSYLARAFWDVGGFDEMYTGGGGEEEDLTFRMLNKGYRVVYDDNAYLWHWRRKGPLDFIKQHYNYGWWGGFLRLRNGHKYAFTLRLLRSISIYSMAMGLLLHSIPLVLLVLPFLVLMTVKSLRECIEGARVHDLPPQWIPLLFLLDLTRVSAYSTGFLVGLFSIAPSWKRKRKILSQGARNP